jgi:hypothetical protein
MIRKALGPEYYKSHLPGVDGEDELFGFHHINHCVNAICQSLTCHADITPLVWSWNENRNMHVEKAHVPHTCRNFGPIQDWARRKNAEGIVGVHHREMNNPLYSKTWVDGYNGD